MGIQTVQKYKRGQIWWLLDPNPDYNTYEQVGSRPVIIISNDTANRFSKLLTVVPCTTAEKKDLPVHVKLEINGPSTALVEQVRTIDNSKLGTYIGTCDDSLMKQLDEAIKVALGLVTVDYSKDMDNSYRTKDEDIVQTNEDKSESISTKGRKKIALDDKIRFINDYENHNSEYMLKKYNIKDKAYLQQKAYLYRKAIKEVS